jgi:ATP-dependent Zn protease
MAKFQSLSKKGKVIVAIQAFIFALVMGGMTKSVYVNHYQPASSTGPPMELPYSRFLDLVEQSGSTATSTMTRGTSAAVAAAPTVIMDNVRIGPEKLVYRLRQQVAGEEKEKSMVCYTHQVAASSELIDTLRKNGIPFAAAPRQRVNTVGMAIRTVIVGFYMLILWRMYRTFSGNSGSGDVPGKLASQSTLPLASFNEIQGIDGAKMEVMELVDTLRNPEKYSILGARAPTGLLLEGT